MYIGIIERDREANDLTRNVGFLAVDRRTGAGRKESVDHGRGNGPRDGDGSIAWNTWRGVTRVTMTSARPSVAVVEAVAAATERDPRDLPVLHDAVDADALDALLDGGESNSRSAVRVEFDYAGVSVDVDSDDGVTIEVDAPDREAVE